MNTITAAINIIMTIIASIQNQPQLDIRPHTFVLFYIVLLLAESQLDLAAELPPRLMPGLIMHMVFKIAPS